MDPRRYNTPPYYYFIFGMGPSCSQQRSTPLKSKEHTHNETARGCACGERVLEETIFFGTNRNANTLDMEVRA